MCEQLADRDRRIYAHKQAKAAALREWHVMIPPKYWTSSFRGFVPRTERQREVAEQLKAWQGDPPFVVLCGPSRVGKTHLAVAKLFRGARCCRRTDHEGVVYPFVDETDLADRWRRANRPGGGDPDAVLDPVIHGGLVVIDDLGKVGSTPKWAAQMFRIINERLNNERPTIITTNLRGAAIEACYGPDHGPAIRHRLKEAMRLVFDQPEGVANDN